MLSVCISPNVIGTDKFLVCEDDGVYWTDTVPSHSYLFSGEIKYLNDKCFDSMLKLADIEIKLDVPQKYVNASKYVNSPFPKWKYIVPASMYRMALEKLLNDVRGSIDLLPKDYFDSAWVTGNHVLRSLKQAKVDKRKLEELVLVEKNTSALNTFKPDAYGICEKIVYNRFGTLTGRLSVESGPSILTLKKELRNILKSKYEDGKILMLDFVSLEANVLIRETFPNFHSDIYEDISKKLNISRKATKAAVIVEMYGGSKKTLIDNFNMQKDTVDLLVSEINKQFNLKNLKKQLIAKIDRGFAFNKYGRPIFLEENPDRIIINYFAQSTGADISLLGYANLLDKLKCIADPIFVLHDSIFLDVHPDCIEEVLSISSLDIEKYETQFSVSTKIIS
jgi:hypothetical protein